MAVTPEIRKPAETPAPGLVDAEGQRVAATASRAAHETREAGEQGGHVPSRVVWKLDVARLRCNEISG